MQCDKSKVRWWVCEKCRESPKDATTSGVVHKGNNHTPFLLLTFWSYFHVFKNLFLRNFSAHMQPTIIQNPGSAGDSRHFIIWIFEYLNFWTCFHLFALTATPFQSLHFTSHVVISAHPQPGTIPGASSPTTCSLISPPQGWTLWLFTLIILTYLFFFFFFCMPLCTPSPQNLSLLCKLSHACEYIIYWSAPSVSSANLTSHQWGKTPLG